MSSLAPGKLWRKNVEMVSGWLSSAAKVDAGAKRVQVKDLSREGIAMNILSELGQMWRWFGLVAKPSLDEGDVRCEGKEGVAGGMVNSHQSVSI